MVVYEGVRGLLFRMDAERVHEFAVRRLAGLQRSPRMIRALESHYVVNDPALAVDAWGLRFPNPVGLAAGFDKSARLTTVIPALGFGFMEVGTVTSEAQEGNPRPRLFRIPEAHALVNRLGFNNDGADAVRERLAKAGSARVPVGVNIGKLKRVPIEEAVADYLRTFEALHAHGSYFVVNVSSPNTPGLRDLQTRDALEALIGRLKHRNRELARARGLHARPLLVKIAPDLDAKALEETVTALVDLRVDGIVATNTTTARPRVDGHPVAREAGGLSGAPLKDRATEVVRRVFELTGGHVPVIGVGGVETAEDAYAKIRAGASLVQLYTGFVYGGPGTASRVAAGLARLLRRDGYASVGDAVGADVP